MGSGTAGARGFLFCDLRGYSAYVDRQGDRAAAELLDRYRTLVREVIARHDGAEIRTEGDSVYVVFPTASSAVEAGLEIVAAAGESSEPAHPIRVGVGIHAGETVETAEGLVGGAVNIAARVCAKAQAGEVLVTDTVRSLTRTGLPYAFVGIGRQHLKGVAGGIALYRVETTAAGPVAHLGRRVAAHRTAVALTVALVALLVVTGAAAWSTAAPQPCLALSSSTKDVVARIDPERMCVVETIPVGRRPYSIVATHTAVFVGNMTDWTVTRIDLASRRPDLTLGMPGAPISMAVQPTDQPRLDVLAFDDRMNRSLRSATSGLLHRIMTVSASGMAVAAQPLVAEGAPASDWTSGIDSSYSGIAAANGRTWVVSRRGGLLRMAIGDALGAPGTSQVIEPDVPAWGGAWDPRPRLIAATGGTVWLADETGTEAIRFEGTASEPSGSVTVGNGGSEAIAATASALWLLGKDGSLSRIDAATNAVRRLELAQSATGLAVAPDAVWLLDATDRTVSRVDPENGAPLGSIEVGGIPAGAVFVDGALWVTLRAP